MMLLVLAVLVIAVMIYASDDAAHGTFTEHGDGVVSTAAANGQQALYGDIANEPAHAKKLLGLMTARGRTQQADRLPDRTVAPLKLTGANAVKLLQHELDDRQGIIWSARTPEAQGGGPRSQWQPDGEKVRWASQAQ